MPTITYTAVDRSELLGGHSAGSDYTLEFELEAYPRSREARGTLEETNEGTPEGYLSAVILSWSLTTDLVLEANIPAWEEFFSSVMNAESFSFDPTGSVATPGTVYTVWMPDRRINRQQIVRHAKFSFRVQKLP